MRLLNLRVTHRDGGLQVLEAARIGDVEGFYREALEGCGVRGAVVIQTCNRTEIFAEVDGGERELDALQSQLLDLWLRYARQPVFHGLVRTSLDGRAVHHLLRLACGLDSMVVGEPQVTEQVADAYGFSKEHGFASPTLSRIFESSLRAARSIRARAGLEEENRNLGELAVRYALNRLSGAMARVLVIGTGKAGRLILEALKRVGVKEVYLAGRSPEHTGQVAARFGAQPVPLESCLEAVGQVDAIFVATTSSVSALTPEKLSQPRWRGRRLLILDLSVPRTVDPRVGALGHVVLATLEDLRGLSGQGGGELAERVLEAEGLAAEEALRIWSRARAWGVEPLLASIFRSAEVVRRRELERALEHLGPQPPQTLLILDRMTRSIVEGVLSGVAQQLREGGLPEYRGAEQPG